MKPKERVKAVLEGEEPDKVPISIFMIPQPIASLNIIEGMDRLKNIRWLPQYQLLKGTFSEKQIPKKLENLILFSVQGFVSEIGDELGCDMIGTLPPTGELEGKAKLNGELNFMGAHYKINDGIFWRKETGEFPVKTIEDKHKIRPVPGPTDKDFVEESLKGLKKKYEDKFLISMIQGPWEALETFMGMENLMKSLIKRPEEIKELLEYCTELQLKTIKPVIQELDSVIIGDDYGTQNNLQISKEMWDEFVRPNLQMMVDDLKKRGYVCLHSCGHVEPLIPDFLDIGFDAINPIQEGANDLDGILEEYDDLVLLGGIDVQKTLPNKSPGEVKERITSIMENAYPNLILSDTNAITNETPVENVRAVFEAHEEFNKSLD